MIPHSVNPINIQNIFHSAKEVNKTLIVADGQCPKIRELLAKTLVPVLWLDGEQDPLTSVTEALIKRRHEGQTVETLHWVSHGQPD